MFKALLNIIRSLLSLKTQTKWKYLMNIEVGYLPSTDINTLGHMIDSNLQGDSHVDSQQISLNQIFQENK